MKHLYNDDDRYTDDASALDRETANALQPIFDKYFAMGYSRRDIYNVMNGAAAEIMLFAVIVPLDKKQ